MSSFNVADSDCAQSSDACCEKQDMRVVPFDKQLYIKQLRKISIDFINNKKQLEVRSKNFKKKNQRVLDGCARKMPKDVNPSLLNYVVGVDDCCLRNYSNRTLPQILLLVKALDMKCKFGRETMRRICRSIYIFGGTKNRWHVLRQLMPIHGFVDIRRGGDMYAYKYVTRLDGHKVLYNEHEVVVSDDFKSLVMVAQIKHHEDYDINGFDLDPLPDFYVIGETQFNTHSSVESFTLMAITYVGTLKTDICHICNREYANNLVLRLAREDYSFVDLHFRVCDLCDWPVVGHTIDVVEDYLELHKASELRAQALEGQDGLLTRAAASVRALLTSFSNIPSALGGIYQNMIAVNDAGGAINFLKDKAWIVDIVIDLIAFGVNIYMFGIQPSLALGAVILKNLVAKFDAQIISFGQSLLDQFKMLFTRKTELNAQGITAEDAGIITAISTFAAFVGIACTYKPGFQWSNIFDIVRKVSTYGFDIVVKGFTAISKFGELLQWLIEKVFILLGYPLNTSISKLTVQKLKHQEWYENALRRNWAGAFANKTLMNELRDVLVEVGADREMAKALRASETEMCLAWIWNYANRLLTAANDGQTMNPEMRPVPTSVQFQGDPAVGKSLLSKLIQRMFIAQVLGIEVKDVTEALLNKHVYAYRTPSTGIDAYMTGLNSDRLILEWSEALSKTDSATAPSVDLDMLMSMVDPAAYITPQAKIEAKANVPFEIPLIIITNNLQGSIYVDNKNYPNPGAIHRRLHLNYVISRKEGFEDINGFNLATYMSTKFINNDTCPFVIKKFRYERIVNGGQTNIRTVIGGEIPFSQLYTEIINSVTDNWKNFVVWKNPTSVQPLFDSISPPVIPVDLRQKLLPFKAQMMEPEFASEVQNIETTSKCDTPDEVVIYSVADSDVKLCTITVEHVDDIRNIVNGISPKKFFKSRVGKFADGNLGIKVNATWYNINALCYFEHCDDTNYLHNIEVFEALGFSTNDAKNAVWFCSAFFDHLAFMHVCGHTPNSWKSKVANMVKVNSNLEDFYALLHKSNVELARMTPSLFSGIVKFVVPVFIGTLSVYAGVKLYKYFKNSQVSIDDVEVLKEEVVDDDTSWKDYLLNKLYSVKERIDGFIDSAFHAGKTAGSNALAWIQRLYNSIVGYFKSDSVLKDIVVPDWNTEAVKELALEYERNRDEHPPKEAARIFADKLADLTYNHMVAQSYKGDNVPRIVRHKPTVAMKAQGASYKSDPDAKNVRAKMLNNTVSFWCSQDDENWVRICCGTFIYSRTCLIPMHCFRVLRRANFVAFFRACSQSSWKGKIDDDFHWEKVKYTDGTEYADLVALTFKNDIVQFPSLLDNFVSENELKSFVNVPVVLTTVEEKAIGKEDGKTVVQLIFKEYHGKNATAIDNKTYTCDKTELNTRKGFSYEFATSDGDCGGGLSAINSSLSRKILGIHVCGNSQIGISVLVTKEVAMLCVPGLKAQCNIANIECYTEMLYYDNGEIVDPLSEIESVEEGDTTLSACTSPYTGSCMVLGKSIYKKSRGSNKIEPSPIVDSLPWKPTKVPSVVTDYVTVDGNRVHLTKQCFDKLHAAAIHLDNDLLEVCAEDAFKPCYGPGWKDACRILSIEEAVFGDSDDAFINSINLNASCGKVWELKIKGGSRGKRQWIDLDKKWIDPELIEACNEQMEDWQSGKRQKDVFSGEKKAELRTPPKDVDPRMYNGGDMVTLINSKRLFGAMVAWCMKQWSLLGICIGINPYKDFGLLGSLLQTKGSKVFAGDFKKFDGSLPTKLLHVALKHMIKWYEAGGINPDFIRAMYTFSNVVRFYAVVLDGVLVVLYKGNPSGNLLTGFINSFCVKISARYIWVMLLEHMESEVIDSSMKSYNEHCIEFVTGDDNVFNVSDIAVEFYNQISIAEGYSKHFGMTYTDELKTGGEIPLFRNIKDVSFLKRNFTDYKWGVLDKITIQEIPCWLKRGASTLDNFHMSLECCLYEASLWGEEYFRYIRSGIVNALRGTDFYKLSVPTWEEVDRINVVTNWQRMPVAIA